MNIFDLANFSDAFGWIINHGYFFMFFAMLIEGPVVTSAAAFALAFGYFSLFPVFLIAILGDIVADILYYFIGYFGRVTIVENFGHKFGLTEDRIKRLESLLNNHPVKTLIAIKLTPLIPTPGLMLVGTTRMPLRKFISTCSLVIVPKTIFFMLIGYYFGQTYNIITQKFERGALSIILFIIAIILTYKLFNKVSSIIAKKIEKL